MFHNLFICLLPIVILALFLYLLLSLLIFLKLLCAWFFVAYLPVDHLHAFRSQKVSNLVEQGLHMIVNCHVGTGNPTQILCKNNQRS